MCRFCDVNILEALAINNKDEAVIINQDVETKEYFIDGLEERIYIEYCPMCRKEAGRVKVEQEIKKEIQKHKEAIQNKIGEKSQDDKIHLWIIQTLEWVLK